jgi:hypothetical protein
VQPKALTVARKLSQTNDGHVLRRIRIVDTRGNSGRNDAEMARDFVEEAAMMLAEDADRKRKECKDCGQYVLPGKAKDVHRA